MPPRNQDTHGLQRPTPGSFPRGRENGVNLPNATGNRLTAALHNSLLLLIRVLQLKTDAHIFDSK